jgi:hypothetical protein
MTARDCQNRVPELFAAFMTTADAAVDGREALTIAPSLPLGGGPETATAMPADTDPALAADALANLAAALRDHLRGAAAGADLLGDRAACQDAAHAAGDLPADAPMTSVPVLGEFLGPAAAHIAAASSPTAPSGASSARSIAWLPRWDATSPTCPMRRVLHLHRNGTAGRGTGPPDSPWAAPPRSFAQSRRACRMRSPATPIRPSGTCVLRQITWPPAVTCCTLISPLIPPGPGPAVLTGRRSSPPVQ